MPRAKRRISKRGSRKRKRSVGRRRPMRRTKIDIEDDGGLAIYQEANRIINTPHDLLGYEPNLLFSLNNYVVEAKSVAKKSENLKKDISFLEAKEKEKEDECKLCEEKLEKLKEKMIKSNFQLENKLRKQLDENRIIIKK